MIEATTRIVFGACIGLALGGFGHWAAREAGLVGTDRKPLVPVSTVRTFTAQIGDRQFLCIETIDHAAGSRSLGC